ncbi:NAD-dependent dehydratase [Pseudoxanthomonas beigongshangi]
MDRLLLAGSTGLVGQAALALALSDDRIGTVIAPTRRPLPSHPRLLNPVIDFERLDADADHWRADAMICALGTTLRDAGSRAAFVRVDFDYPLALARLLHRHGARTLAVVSATGARVDSRVFYSRTKGELEQALAACGFASLTFVRPALLGGERTQRRTGEHFALRLLTALDPIVPARYRVVPATAVAATLLDAAHAAVPGVRIIESEAIPR